MSTIYPQLVSEEMLFTHTSKALPSSIEEGGRRILRMPSEELACRTFSRSQGCRPTGSALASMGYVRARTSQGT